MMVRPANMEETTFGASNKNNTSYVNKNNAISNPSTLPHFILLLLNASIIYLLMKSNYGLIGAKGSSIFLSLSISYCIAAYIYTTEFGLKTLKIEDNGMGILTTKYWFLAIKAVIPMVFISLILILIINIFFTESEIDYFMSSLFIVMSIGQGISIITGGVIYYDSKDINGLSSNTENYRIIRVVFIIIIFIPLIWWFGYGAENALDKTFVINLLWILYAISIGLVAYLLDRFTSNARNNLGLSGAKADKFLLLMIITISWHLLSAWRRNPILVESTDLLMLFEEGILMLITIFLIVNALIKKGKKRGWKIFEGQSAIFWGVAFGYAYSGSISSLTILSERLTESSLLQTTALGHLLTAFVIILILPNSIKKFMIYEEE
ncbi:MAG: hypothetical protein HN533_00205 [Euryarchaeota archaeon]|jgi:hypothetical protein|nr:hypothetical protein [Euryarchaeota archaeon]MBT4802718.1 hypothetical protein [Euryarchaeota archaeon]MBT6684096.1 hypothetical protein [Euryarchaeota archaeon]MBT7413426.1 hypothetical protein [Euryarchaeota archaeon]